MRWFRSKMQFGSRLALVALALQIVLTFGHVHSFVPTAVDTALSSAVAASDGSNSRDPSQNGLADFDCPICALINLAGTSTLSVAPDLPLPASVDFVTLRPPGGTGIRDGTAFPAQGPRAAFNLRQMP
jgi:hypothetical protein